MIIVTIALIISASISKAVMDKIQFHYSNSVFNKENPLFWNPKESWKNKWKDRDKSNGERFFGSSTIFVFLTDAWHLFQSYKITALFLAMVTYEPVITLDNNTLELFANFILLKSIYTGFFELFFTYIFESK